MADQKATTVESDRVRLPRWLEGVMALFGAVLLAGPALAVLWCR